MSSTEPRGETPRSGVGRAGKRRMARQMALQMLYQFEMGGEADLPQIFRAFDRSGYFRPPEGASRSGLSAAERRAAGERRQQEVEAAFEFARRLVQGTIDHRVEIDALITTQADNWRLERMPAVDRNILRLAVYELLHDDDTPPLVVVDEAIELAKKFSTEQSGRFVNGLLDGVIKRRGGPPGKTEDVQ